MKKTHLSGDVTSYLQHIKGWQSLISDDVATILEKLAQGKHLTRPELDTDVTPTEVAAIWSVKYKMDINPRYVREVKRKGRIDPSREWGQGPMYRCLYRVKEVLPIEVSHRRGRPHKGRKEKEVGLAWQRHE